MREIRKYIECELLAPVAEKNTVAAIKAGMQSLTHMPARIHLTPEQPWHDQGVRRDRANNYYIYFWIDEENKKVQIIGVILRPQGSAEAVGTDGDGIVSNRTEKRAPAVPLDYFKPYQNKPDTQP